MDKQRSPTTSSPCVPPSLSTIILQMTQKKIWKRTCKISAVLSSIEGGVSRFFHFSPDIVKYEPGFLTEIPVQACGEIVFPSSSNTLSVKDPVSRKAPAAQVMRSSKIVLLHMIPIFRPGEKASVGNALSIKAI